MNIKDLYIDYFKSKGHSLIHSAPIVPENDPTCLFNTAGMQPLVPYLMGQVHPLGTRLVNYQKCFRTNDLDSIGDKTHHTFFEMLGNWSLGNYFKKESISFSFEFLTEILKIPVSKLAVTVFRGNDLVPADEESAEIWNRLGIVKERIAYLGEEDNWWGPAGETGPCGPDTEIFYFRSDDEVPEVFDPEDNRWVEIWNNVFMQYNKKDDGSFILLDKKNVDTGMGVERVTAILEHVDDNYLTSIFKDVIEKLEELSGLEYNDDNCKSMRIIADHIRAIVIITGEDSGIKPSNTDQGYILRRLIRRAIRYAKKLGIDINTDFDLVMAHMFIDKYKKYYPELEKNEKQIIEVLNAEKSKFSRTLEKGLREFDKLVSNIEIAITSEVAFKLYDTYGFPIELTVELASEKNLEVDVDGFNERFKKHQEMSRAGAEQKFKGGLSGDSDIDIKYHTATHLLNAALKEVLGIHVHQKGSNITPERMRFDFSHNEKMTPEQIKQVEDLVNNYIKQDLSVVKKEMSKEEAISTGAEAMFIEKYGDIVTVYEIGNISKELCGGPHVNNTNELGTFSIIKEEASSAGVRRIKAVLK